MIITKRLLVHGRVQGVGYRYEMLLAARRLGITGWVRNRNDGSVEALIQGTANSVEQLITWAHRGPHAALVQRLQTLHPESEEIYSDFRQLPTV